MDVLAVGLSLGLAAGLSPGPLLALVLGATLQRGFPAGARVAASPLVTDLPIVVLALWMAGTVPSTALALMALVGGAFVVYLGVGIVRDASGDLDWITHGEPGSSTSEPDPAARRERRESLRRDLWHGALVNIASPHPWLFWLGIGGPQVVAVWRRDSPWAGWSAAGFLVLFYLGLVGSKVVLAAIVARGRHRLNLRWYRRILAACGWLLVGLGAWLAFDAGHGLLDL